MATLQLAPWFLSAALALGGDATIPGAVTTPYPTIINLSVEWKIEGDDNLNGVVAVRYRKAGETRWHEAMPLRRVPAGQSIGTRPIYSWENKHSGSLFDLQPGTGYQIHLKLSDPDGGTAERMVAARTRPVPRAAAKARTRTVTPATIDSARPGQTLLLAPGDYGHFRPAVDGEPGRPIVYRSADGGAVFDRITLDGRRHVYLEGLTVRASAGEANRSGTAISLNGAEHCVVRRCRIKAVYGVRAERPPGCRNCYVADNVVEGVNPWADEAMGASGKNIGEGIQLAGPGNVIAFNRVTGFRDCISTMEETAAFDQISVDIYNNDIDTGVDDGIEADFCYSNCRIVRNRITNSFMGLSSQPGLGGPTYFIRNVMYNIINAPFKLHRFSRGDVVLHNTTVKIGDGMACLTGQPFDHAYFRNNLSIGGAPGLVKWGGYGAGSGRAANLVAHGPHCSFDYDAVGTHEMPFDARIGGRDFSDVEPHGIRVDLGVFEGVEFPSPPLPQRQPADLRPRAGSKVVDAALPLANVNDQFLGKGPDIGAYEAGQEPPVYGPRPEGQDESSPARRLRVARPRVR